LLGELQNERLGASQAEAAVLPSMRRIHASGSKSGGGRRPRLPSKSRGSIPAARSQDFQGSERSEPFFVFHRLYRVLGLAAASVRLCCSFSAGGLCGTPGR
jgi:hypothetical protein